MKLLPLKGHTEYRGKLVYVDIPDWPMRDDTSIPLVRLAHVEDFPLGEQMIEHAWILWYRDWKSTVRYQPVGADPYYVHNWKE